MPSASKPRTKRRKAVAATASSDRIQKTLYLPEQLNRELRVRAAELGVQQSELVADALAAYFASKPNRK